MKSKPQQPLIKRDRDIGWEVFVPPHMLPFDLRVVSLSPEGLYIETTSDAWDLIPFQELADLVVDSSRTLDESIDVDPTDYNRSLIAKLSCPVNVAAGQPEEILSGQERAYRRWNADQRYDDGGLWHSDYVERI